MSKDIKRLRVFGVGLRSDGYPNAWQTIRLLRAAGWVIDDKSYWLPENTHLWSLARGPLKVKISIASKLIGLSFLQTIRLLAERNKDYVYVPYPSVFLLWWLAWVPRCWRPRCIVDAYISIWDSMYRDRSPSAQRSLLSRLLYRFEGRALRAATMVLSDTETNEKCLAKDFHISQERLYSLPLAIDERRLLDIQPLAVNEKKIRVLFVGTMIPLHGINVILETIRILKDEQKIEFRLIGNGQVASEVEELIRQLGTHRMTWVTKWQDASTLAREIADADICLGVFGGAGKASRVLPFKVYMALAAGRVVISQRQHSLPRGASALSVCWVDSASDKLVQKITELAKDESSRLAIARAGREHYLKMLSNAAVERHWYKLIQRTLE